MLSAVRPIEGIHGDSNLEIINTNSLEYESNETIVYRPLFVSSYEDRQDLRKKYTQLIHLVEGIATIVFQCTN